MDPDEPDGLAWGQAFLDLTRRSRLRLGLTGTPFRADNLAFCAARRVQTVQNGMTVELISPDLCVEPRELIAAGDVRPLEFHFQDGWVEHAREGLPDRDVSPLSEERRESWRARNLRRAIRMADSSCIGQQVLLRAQRKLEQIRRQQPRAAGLVIARDIAHAEAITQILEDDGNRVDLVHFEARGLRSTAAVPDERGRLAGEHRHVRGGIRRASVAGGRLPHDGGDPQPLRAGHHPSRADDGGPGPIGADPSPSLLVYAPADPLLMSYARTWSMAEPSCVTRLMKAQSLSRTPHPARPCSCRWKRLRTGLAR